MAELATDINSTTEVDSCEEELDIMAQEIHDLHMHMERIDQKIQSNYSFFKYILKELDDLKILVSQMVSNQNPTGTVSPGRSQLQEPSSAPAIVPIPVPVDRNVEKASSSDV